jgi:hypothetical protein
MVVWRLSAEDEHLHAWDGEPTFNESMYTNFFDPNQELGGFVRLGNRPGEHHAEMTVCLFLPQDARGRRPVAFMFQRPEIHGNDALDAGGLRFEVRRPFEHLEVAYEGTVLMLEDPMALLDPKAAFSSGPYEHCTIALRLEGIAPPFGGEPDQPIEGPDEQFARGHYEVLVEATGTIELGDRTTSLQGFGLRDHSWGPRTWQAPWYYRWLTANFGRDTGFMGSRIARREGPGTRGGFIFDAGELAGCDAFELRTTWDASGQYQQRVQARLVADNGVLEADGEVLVVVPLRNRRRAADGERVTRIAEGLTRWRLADGRVGWGLSEYLDQVVDGRPVGLAE